MKRWCVAIVALALFALPARAQFSLYQNSCTTGQLVSPVFSFGSVNPDQQAAAPFCLLNSTKSTQTVALLSVTGVGFALPNAAAPMSLKAGDSVDFTVTFEGGTTGYYSGSLDITGISVLLTAAVVPGLTYEVQLTSGASPLGAAGVNFGNVQVGSNATLSFLAVNQTASTLTVEAIGVTVGDFALTGPSPSGTALDPQTSASFPIEFSPTAAGTRTAVLSIGAMQFPLAGMGTTAPLPAPVVAVTLPAAEPAGEAHSAQQGTVAVSFGAAAEAGGAGTVTLAFTPETAGYLDPGIAFASGGQTAAFSFNKDDAAASFGGAASVGFQTGTTAGTLVVEARIGNQVSQQAIAIAPAAIAVTAATGTQAASAVTIDITGFDNTRSAGLLTFTFYDSSGGAILPGAIVYDSTALFSSYFAGSGDGGQFALSAYFPVNGNATQVSAFTVQLANSAGTTTTARASF